MRRINILINNAGCLVLQYFNMSEFIKNIFAYPILILVLCATFFAVLSVSTFLDPLGKLLPEPIIRLLGMIILLTATLGSPYVTYRIAKRENFPGLRITKIILVSIGIGATLLAFFFGYVISNTTF